MASKILIADDFQLSRLIMRGMLGELGYTDIEEASDGNIAIKMLMDAHAQGAPFAVIFCDWNMPVMPGLKVLELCRQTAELATIPFVMVTAESEQKSILLAMQTGATDYLIKPITKENLERKAAKILKK